MKKGKKIVSMVLGVVLATGLLGSCAEEDKIKLVDFKDITAQGTLGENFSLTDYLTVRDEQSNAYKATVSVKDVDGNEVNVSSNRFRINRFSTYTVTLSYTVAEGDIRTRTLTINVVDKGAPVISVSCPSATIGEEYTIPTPTVTDASGENITPSIKLYAGVGDSKTEVPLVDGKFTPTKRGKYTLEITATDSSGNESVATKIFRALNKGELTPLVVFDDDSSLSRVSTDSYVTIGKSFISEADIAADATLPALPEGSEGGYLKLDCTGNGNSTESNHWLNVRISDPECSLEDFLNGDYVELTAYVTNTKNPDSTDVKVMYRNSMIDTIAYNQWQIVKIPLSTFYRTAASTHPADITELYNSLNSTPLFNFNTGNINHDILEPVYISSVRLIQKQREESVGDALVILNENTYNTALAFDKGVSYGVSWDQEENAVKIEPAAPWGTTTPPTTYLALGIAKLSKNFSELQQYSKVRFVVKSAVTRAPWIKHDIDGGDYVKTEYAVTEITEGEDAGWKYVEMDMKTFVKYFYFVEHGERILTWEGNIKSFNYDSATGIYTGEYLDNWWIKAITLVK